VALDASAKSDKTTIIPTVGEINFDKPSYEADFTIKNDNHAREVAIAFAENVG
jgi:hypothetical protein